MAQTPSSPPTVPMPAHLKRGTLSFKISPARALKKQKSMHSLRRQMNENASRSNSGRRPDLERSASQETILVQLSDNDPYTPERVPPVPAVPQPAQETAKYRPHDSVNTWISDSAADDDDNTPDERQPAQMQPGAARYPVVNDAYNTPTRAPLHHGPGANALGSPYTPTNQGGSGKAGNGMLGAGLRVPRPVEDTRRDTTFSAMMERAGLRRSDWVPLPSRR